MNLLRRLSRQAWGPSLLLLPALPWLWAYLHPGLAMALGLMVAPFVWQLHPATRPRPRYAWLSLGLLALHLTLGNNLFLWLALGCFGLALVEQQYRQTSWVPLLLLGLVSPLISSWVRTFSFPLRLWLSEQTGRSLQAVGMEVVVKGNRFYWGESWFEVEAACLGLSTLTLALVLVTLLLGLGEKARGRFFSLAEAGAWLLLGTALAVGANFARTLWLVLLRSPAGTLGHELIGLLAIVSLVGLPLAGLMRLRVGGSLLAAAPGFAFRSLRPPAGWVWGLALLLGLAGWRAEAKLTPDPSPALQAMTVPGWEKALVQPDVVRFTTGDLLVYIKAPVPAWRAGHDPEVCWAGSGYRLGQLESDTIGGRPVRRGLLIQEADTLYTAWWFDNGRAATASQWTWRWDAVRGAAPYFLWNVTAGEEGSLVEGIKQLQEGKLSP